MECNIRDVTSGVPQMACWGELSIVIYGIVAYIQMAAASHTGEIPSYLDTDPEFQHWPFKSGSSNSDLFDTGQSGWLPPGTGEITISEWSCRAS